MSALAGRDVVVYRNSVAVIAGQAKEFAIAKEAIDITSDDDAGFRTLLATSSVKTLDITLEAVLKDDIFLAEINTDILESYEVDIPGIGSITGDFKLTAVSLSAPVDAAVTQSVTLTSSGAFTFTPEST